MSASGLVRSPPAAGPESALERPWLRHYGAIPREIEFRRQLPLTRVGKVDYRALQREHEGSTQAPA